MDITTKAQQASTTGTDKEKAEKKAFSLLKKDFNLHVGLVVRQDTKNLSDARVIAYAEGSAGLARRLGAPRLV